MSRRTRRTTGAVSGRAAAAADRTCKRPPRAWTQSTTLDVGIRPTSHLGRGLVATLDWLLEQAVPVSMTRVVQ